MSSAAADREEGVAGAQLEAGEGPHLELGAGDARDPHAEPRREVELAERLPDDLLARHDEPLARDRRRKARQVEVALLAHEEAEVVEVLPRPDREEDVAEREPRLGTGDEERAARGGRARRRGRARSANGSFSRRRPSRFAFVTSRFARWSGGRLAPQGPREELLLERHRDAERELERDHREDDARDAERVGDRVAERRDRRGAGGGGGVPRHLPERLLGRGEARGVRRRSGEDADDGRELDAEEEVGRGRERDAREDDRRREEVQLQAAPAERGDEAGADLQADRGDEEDQAEVPHELQDGRLDHDAEVPEEEADEEDPCRRQADAPDLHGAEGQARGRRRGRGRGPPGPRGGPSRHCLPRLSRGRRGRPGLADVAVRPVQTFAPDGRIVRARPSR